MCEKYFGGYSMDKKRKFRHENKYLITAGQMELLRNRIEGICDLDRYSKTNGDYNIRSLYFDDYRSNSFGDNEIGVDNRSKYRIRIYNHSPETIVLERKIKENGMISKDRAVIKLDFLKAILEDRVMELDIHDDNPLINRFLLEYHTRYLRPRVIVEYDREAYIMELEDIRITFDKNISFSGDISSFLEEEMFLQPITLNGKELLEVKYTEMLPDFIYESLNLGKMQQITFSKYYLSEKYRRKEII